MGEANNHLIILEKVPEERQPEAALFLSGCFSLPPVSTRGIAASGPIILLSGLPKATAEAISAELAATLPAGVLLRLGREGESQRLGRLQWPRPPRVYGRDLDDFSANPECHDLTCPLCGGQIRICREGESFRAAPAPFQERPEGASAGAPSAANDKDPLFSGIKPLATADANFASLRSLQAGDTGFWMEHDSHLSAVRPPPAASADSGEAPSGVSGKSAFRPAAGLAAYMKPGVFALVVGRTRDNQAVKMVAEIMGVDDEEARSKCQGLGLVVAKDIALDEAQNLRSRFTSLGTRARIVKPM